MSAGGSWPGCHGVRVSGAVLEVGTASGEPIADAVVRVADVPPPDGPELWRIHGEVTTADVTRTVERWLCRQPDGSFGVHASAGPSLAVDPATDEIAIEPGEEPVVLQLLTSFALPLVLNGHGALALHASACERDGRAVVVCGTPGSGKSSSLVGMVAAGWRALSEDVCAIDLRHDVPRVWPGPPWVRRRHGEPGPPGSTPRFETPDKTAWDIGPWQVAVPVPVSKLVILEPPGGDVPRWEPLSPADVLRAMAPHTAWLRDPAEASRALFSPAIRLATTVPAGRLRLPRHPAWLDDLSAVLAERP